MLSFDYFKEYADEEHHKREGYRTLMQEYAEHTIRQFSSCSFTHSAEFAECISNRYLERCESAKLIFDSMGLRDIHAYSMAGSLNDFIDEYDENEMPKRDFE